MSARPYLVRPRPVPPITPTESAALARWTDAAAPIALPFVLAVLCHNCWTVSNSRGATCHVCQQAGGLHSVARLMQQGESR